VTIFVLVPDDLRRLSTGANATAGKTGHPFAKKIARKEK
jgi:hypothetical protein